MSVGSSGLPQVALHHEQLRDEDLRKRYDLWYYYAHILLITEVFKRQLAWSSRHLL
jgi:hypothetical protein